MNISRSTLILAVFFVFLHPFASGNGEPCSAEETEATFGFRGDGNGQFSDARPPIRWSEDKGVVWKVALPGNSYSSPVLQGDRLFISSDPAELICVRANDGMVLWRRSHSYADVFPADKVKMIEAQHEKAKALRRDSKELRRKLRALKRADEPDEAKIEQLDTKIRALRKVEKSAITYPPVKRGGSGNSAATPVSDGRRVFALYTHGLLAAYTMNGEKLWAKHIQTPVSGFGHSSSPLIVGNHLVIHATDMVALNTSSGEEVWRVKLRQRWGTPKVVKVGDVDLICTAGGDVLRADTGKKLNGKGLYNLGHNSPITHGGVLYAMGAGRYHAFKIPVSADQGFKPLWDVRSGKQRTFASPVYHDGKLYQLSEKGVFQVIDAKGGEEVYKKRLDFGSRTRVFASISLAGGKLFVASENGTCLVLRPGEKYDELARNSLDSISGTPIFAGNRMYLRGKQHLYCLGDN